MADLAEQLPAPENSRETASRPPEGRRFEKGRSGNPGGRPKGLAAASRDVLRHAVDEGEDPALALARFWASIMGDPTEKMELRLQAADRLADRGYGKAPQFAPIEDADPLGLTASEEEEIVADFDRKIDEVAARRLAREQASQAV